MVTKTSVLKVLRIFAGRQKSALVHFSEFCEYMRRFAQHHLEEDPDLVPFLSDTEAALQNDIAALEEKRSIIILNPDSDKKTIIVIPYYAEKYANRYQEMLSNPAIPFPLITDLPKQTPPDLIERKQASVFLIDLLEEQHLQNETESAANRKSSYSLYALELPREVPAILFSAITPVDSLLDISLAKIRQMLSKEEFHDYFLKKLKISNPGKEISVKSFFAQFIQRPIDTIESIKNSGDSFYFWSQLCFFIRQDYEKVKDYTPEDVSILQSVYLTEIMVGYYKNKTQQDFQRTNALRILEQNLNKPPFYFTKETIGRFTDSRGIPLLGQYTDRDLTAFLHTATTVPTEKSLPNLLTFKTVSGERYYINITKLIPLTVRLCTDARETIRDSLTRKWFDLYKKFESIPAMTDQRAFEKLLEQEMQDSFPILFAILNSNFLSLVYYETQMTAEMAEQKVILFVDGKLLPYSDLLLISRHEITTDAKILLPFWYTVPIVSWFARFFLKPNQPKTKKSTGTAEILQVIPQDDGDKNNDSDQIFRKQELREAAIAAEKKLVPAGSTLEKELSVYIHQWNKILDVQLSENLTEDVNSLIRDYMRKTLRSLKTANFSVDRIENLADILVKSPSLQKIKDSEQLKIYISLYIIKLIKAL